jgi:molybdenum cofactor biosynthesis enzyme MoaA
MFTGIEMKIEVTNWCLHGRCKFCSPLFRPTVQEAEARQFLKTLEGHIDYYLRNGGRRILLTGGGEPIDAPKKLFGAIEIINRKKVELGVELELLTVFTNGVKILSNFSRASNETYLDVLVRLGVRDINLSIHGGTASERRFTSGRYMGAINVDQLIPEIRRRGVRVMTRSVLAEGGIDSVEKIDTFARHMDALGVHMAYFSDLFQVPLRNERTVPGSKKVLNWTDAHRVAFEEILSEIMNSEDFELVKKYRRHNGQGGTFEFRRRGHKILIMLGDLMIGNESTGEPTYAYVKPDGSMADTNNARDHSVPASKTKRYLMKFRPGRDDL